MDLYKHYIFMAYILMALMFPFSSTRGLFLLIGVLAFGRFLALALDGSAEPARAASLPVSSGSAASARVELPQKRQVSVPDNLKCPSCGAAIKPTDQTCAYCGSHLKALVETSEPQHLAGLIVGQSVRISKPSAEDAVYQVRGRLLYTELWQSRRGADVPWTPTGNVFAGFVLEPQAYLLNWQGRFYLLGSPVTLTDQEISRDFLPHAKRFSQSDQTAKVEFSYGGSRWRMDDIGRFALESVEGQGAHLGQGAIGRFIHASAKNQALVLEDFQSGGSGGRDTLWKGSLLKIDDIHF